MALDRYFEGTVTHNEIDEDNIFSIQNGKSDSDKVSASDDNSSGNFDCNICLESVQDPVVTLCGHLYCWPCIFKWLDLQSISTKDEDQTQKQCPVCKTEISQTTLVPLYGRGQSTNSHHSSLVPKRPLGPVYGVDIPRPPANLHLSEQIHVTYPHGTNIYPRQSRYPFSPMLSTGAMSYSNVLDPVIGVFGETVCARLLGTSNTSTNPNSHNFVGNGNARVRRQMIETDKSLRRICFFFLCCVLLCLILF